MGRGGERGVTGVVHVRVFVAYDVLSTVVCKYRKSEFVVLSALFSRHVLQ